MHSPHDFLLALTTVLAVAALTTVVFQKLRQPVVLGYIIAGLIIGPHVPIPLVADTQVVETLSELGVILLMFSLGLEFSIRNLLRVGSTAGVTAIVQSSLMVWLGFVAGRLFGWTQMESVFTGAIVAISSTTIIAKAFDERGIRGKLRDIVVGILIVEDLIAILLMATLTAVASGNAVSAGSLFWTLGRLAAFLLVLVVVGLFVVPRAVRGILGLKRKETTLVASIGFCFAIALLAQQFGYSVALGAFLAGSLVAESGRGEEIEHLVQPVRDMFAAIFFVSVGMLINPALVLLHWIPIVVLTLVVVVGKIAGVSIGAFLTGNGTRTSVQAGMSLAQIGEFSFIIAGLGLSLGVTRDFLYPVAVAVSALTTLSTPWLIGASGPAANWVDRKLPPRVQTFAALYGSWIEEARARKSNVTVASAVRKNLAWLIADAALLSGIILGTCIWMDAIVAWAGALVGTPRSVTASLVVGVAAALSIPFCVGIVQVARRLGVTLAESALPPVEARHVDFAAAPRRAFVVTLQLMIVLIVGAPLVALTQPFLPGFEAAELFLLLMVVLGYAFWRSAANLHGHVRAGAQMVVEALAAELPDTKAATDDPRLERVHALLPGLGTIASTEIADDSPVVGKTLAELNLRGYTGASVIAIARAGERMIVPNAKEVLRAGDILGLAGTHEAVDAAKRLLVERNG